MARIIRATRRARRRTTWIGDVNVNHTTVASGATSLNTILDPEIDKFAADATLVRIRGVILIDMNASITPPDDENHVTGIQILVNSEAGSGFDDAGYGREEILWHDLVGQSSDWRDVATAEAPDMRYGFIHPHLKCYIDVKAMRKLGDRQKVHIAVHNFAGAANSVQIAYNYALRCLVME